MTVQLNVTNPNVITNENGQFRSAVGTEAIEAYRLRVLISGLKLEHRTGGKMRVSRNVNCLAIAKKTTGLKTNDRLKHIERLEAMLNAQLDKTLIVEAGEQNYGPTE